MEETLTQAKLESDEKHQGRLVVAKDMKSCFPQSNTHYFTGNKESLSLVMCGIPAWDLYLSGMLNIPSFYTGILIVLD